MTLAALDDSVSLVATVTDKKGDTLPDASVSWSTSDASVATVSSSGLVTAVGNGTAQVVARSGTLGSSGTVADTASVTVRQTVSSVTVEPDSLVLPDYGTGVLTAKAVDANGNDVDVAAIDSSGFSWKSSNVLVATVTSLGGDSARVGSQRGGLAQVTATLSGVSGSARVRVYPATAASLSLDKDSVAFAAFDDTVSLVATVTDQGGHIWPGAEVTWSTSDTTVATVSSSGLVTAVGNGGARVVALSGTVADTVSVRGAPSGFVGDG